MRKDILEKKDQILQWVEEKQSKAFICRQIKCKQETLNSYLKKMGIEYEGNQGGKNIKNAPNYIPALEYLKLPQAKTYVLKLKLLKEGIKEAKCEICGLSEWMGQPIPLELHHKDCDHYNNELDNLQIICPNCHAQKEGNSGANIHRYES